MKEGSRPDVEWWRGKFTSLRKETTTRCSLQDLSRPGNSALDARTTRHSGYGISQRIRQHIEQAFG